MQILLDFDYLSEYNTNQREGDHFEGGDLNGRIFPMDSRKHRRTADIAWRHQERLHRSQRNRNVFRQSRREDPELLLFLLRRNDSQSILLPLSPSNSNSFQ